MATAKKITFRDGLHDIEHQKIDVDTRGLRKDITSALKGLKIKPMWLKPATFRDSRERNPCGLAFAISKFEPSFIVNLPGSTFRYRDTEVQEALRGIIGRRAECSGLVRWDRGMGVFVFNVYVKG